MAEKPKLIAKVTCPNCQNVCKVKHPMKAGVFTVPCSACNQTFKARFEEPKQPSTDKIVKDGAEKPESNVPQDATGVFVSPSCVLRKCKLVHVRPFLFFFTRKTPYFLRIGTTTVGRKDYKTPSNISIVGDPYMNRRSVAIHVEPYNSGYLYKMEVLKSTNSVYRNGHLLTNNESVYLRYNDEIVIGRTKFVLEMCD